MLFVDLDQVLWLLVLDTSMGGLYGIAPLYRASPEMFERIDVLKALQQC